MRFSMVKKSLAIVLAFCSISLLAMEQKPSHSEKIPLLQHDQAINSGSSDSIELEDKQTKEEHPLRNESCWQYLACCLWNKQNNVNKEVSPESSDSEQSSENLLKEELEAVKETFPLYIKIGKKEVLVGKAYYNDEGALEILDPKEELENTDAPPYQPKHYYLTQKLIDIHNAFKNRVVNIGEKIGDAIPCVKKIYNNRGVRIVLELSTKYAIALGLSEWWQDDDVDVFAHDSIAETLNRVVNLPIYLELLLAYGACYAESYTNRFYYPEINLGIGQIGILWTFKIITDNFKKFTEANNKHHND